jgi:pyruvate dehydrogenase E1 component
LVAATIPNCKSYDPAFAGELAVIVDAGMRQMLVEQLDVFYYITLMNENYAQPNLRVQDHEGVLRGAYLYCTTQTTQKPHKKTPTVTLMGSGAIFTEVVKAAQILAEHGITSSVISVTSWSELARDAAQCNELDKRQSAWLTKVLKSTEGPIIAATDYVRAVPDSIRAYLAADRAYITLGTDGFGRSDTRAALRAYFKVDAASIVSAVLKQAS